MKRERWIDSWKGLLIFLVVFGHVVGAMCHFAQGSERESLVYCYRWIYLFHMPAFFVVAGYVMGRKGLRVEKLSVAEEKLGLTVGKKAKRLLVPYFVWGVVSVIVFLLTLSIAGEMRGNDGYYGERMFAFEWWRPFVSLLHAGGWPNGEGFRCNSVLWFLPVMFFTSITYSLLRNLLRVERVWVGWTMMLACFAAGGMVRLYVGMLPWGLDRVPRFLGFVLLGSQLRVEREMRGFGVWKFGGLVVGLVAYSWLVTVFPDLAWPYRSWRWYWAEIGMAVVGSLISLGAAKIVDCRLLASWGVASLGIMVTHKFLIMGIQMFGGLEAWRFGGLMALLVTMVAWGATKAVRKWAPWVVGETKSLL